MDDKKLSIVLMAPIVVLTAQYLILVSNNLIGTENGLIVQLISKVVVAIMFIYTLPIVLKRKKITFVSVYSIALFIFLSNFMIFPENQQSLLAIIFPFFFMSLPAFLYSRCIDDWNVLKHIMRKAALIVFIVGTATGLLVFIGEANIGDYSMSLSYYMLLPAIIYLDEFIDKPALKPVFAAFLSLLVILALGSRGAIICIVIFFALKIIRPNSKMNYKRIFLYFITIATVLFSVAFLQDILEFIYNFLIKYGIRSRTLELFLMDLGHLSGREGIYENVIEGLLGSPFIGIGIAGDREVNGGDEGAYAHNFFLEVLSNFGILFGSILLAIFLLMIMNNLFVKDRRHYNIVIIWLSLGFVPLMVSGSYLTEINFWIFTGLISGYFLRFKYRK